MSRQILVFGEKTFTLTIPDDAKVTFGPWSPPKSNERDYSEGRNMRGTLRVYGRTKEDILAVFSGVLSFRDLSLEYAEEVEVLKGETVWHSDQHGYHTKSESESKKQWVPGLPVPDQL